MTDIEPGRANLQWTQVNNWVMLSGVPSRSLAAYVFLKAHVNSETGVAYPGTARLATFLGLSRSDKVAAAIRPLVEIGAVTVERRGIPARNVYIVHDLPPDGYTGPLSVRDWSTRNLHAIDGGRTADRDRTRRQRDHSTPVTPPVGEQDTEALVNPVTPPEGEPVNRHGCDPVTPPEGELIELDREQLDLGELDRGSEETPASPTSLHSPAGVAPPRQLGGTGSMRRQARKPSTPRHSTPIDDPEFVEFWDTYPRKIAKGTAVKAWKRAIASGATPADIIAGARSYAAARAGHDPRYTAYPATWLNGLRWTDQPDTTSAQQSERRSRSGPYRDPVIPAGVDPDDYWAAGL